MGGPSAYSSSQGVASATWSSSQGPTTPSRLASLLAIKGRMNALLADERSGCVSGAIDANGQAGDVGWLQHIASQTQQGQVEQSSHNAHNTSLQRPHAAMEL
jgi:hypothetical protein